MAAATKNQKKLIWSWALYDWANSAFATTVMAGFFPLFFKAYWSSGFSVVESTSVLALTNSVASLFLALSAPPLGAIADAGAWRKKFLFVFTLLGALSSIALAGVSEGEWLTASILYAFGVVGFIGAITFYDSLLVQVVEPQKFDRVSGLGYAVGYLGGGILFALNVWMYSSPDTFRITDKLFAIKLSFVTVGVWWLLFSLPLFVFVPEWKSAKKPSLLKSVQVGFKELKRHLKLVLRDRRLLFFLIGYLFYIDGVNTIVKMAVDYGMSIGLEAGDLIKALLMVQFIGFPAAIGFGYLGERFGPKTGIWICLLVYLGITIHAYFITSATEFYVLAGLIGLVQGGIQALSRSYYARLIPAQESAQYFGFFNMIGKFSSILGPMLVALLSYSLNNSRAGILGLVVFFVLGGLFLHLSQASRKG